MTASSCVFFFAASMAALISTLSLHDALPISSPVHALASAALGGLEVRELRFPETQNVAGQTAQTAHFAYAEIEFVRNSYLDRKSTRLNSSHTVISYAVFCLKKKTP